MSKVVFFLAVAACSTGVSTCTEVVGITSFTSSAVSDLFSACLAATMRLGTSISLASQVIFSTCSWVKPELGTVCSIRTISSRNSCFDRERTNSGCLSRATIRPSRKLLAPNTASGPAPGIFIPQTVNHSDSLSFANDSSVLYARTTLWSVTDSSVSLCCINRLTTSDNELTVIWMSLGAPSLPLTWLKIFFIRSGTCSMDGNSLMSETKLSNISIVSVIFWLSAPASTKRFTCLWRALAVSISVAERNIFWCARFITALRRFSCSWGDTSIAFGDSFSSVVVTSGSFDSATTSTTSSCAESTVGSLDTATALDSWGSTSSSWGMPASLLDKLSTNTSLSLLTCSILLWYFSRVLCTTEASCSAKFLVFSCIRLARVT